MQRAKRPVLAGVFATTLMLSGMAPLSAEASNRPGQEYGKESAREFAMVGDIFLVRPVMGLITVAGLATFTATLPFSALGNNVDEAAETLVRHPANNTFLRCLACTPTEHEQKQRERRTRKAEREAQR